MEGVVEVAGRYGWRPSRQSVREKNSYRRAKTTLLCGAKSVGTLEVKQAGNLTTRLSAMSLHLPVFCTGRSA